MQVNCKKKKIYQKTEATSLLQLFIKHSNKKKTSSFFLFSLNFKLHSLYTLKLALPGCKELKRRKPSTGNRLDENTAWSCS